MCSIFRWSTVICRISAFSSLADPWRRERQKIDLAPTALGEQLKIYMHICTLCVVTVQTKTKRGFFAKRVDICVWIHLHTSYTVIFQDTGGSDECGEGFWRGQLHWEFYLLSPLPASQKHWVPASSAQTNCYWFGLADASQWSAESRQNKGENFHDASKSQSEERWFFPLI